MGQVMNRVMHGEAMWVLPYIILQSPIVAVVVCEVGLRALRAGV